MMKNFDVKMQSQQLHTFTKGPPIHLKELAASLDLVWMSEGDLRKHGKLALPPVHEWLTPLVDRIRAKGDNFVVILTARFLSAWLKTWCLARKKELRLWSSPFDFGFLDLGSGDLVTRFKDFCLWPVTLMLQGVELSCPFVGKFKRTMTRWLKTRHSRRKFCFVQTILQLKRVSPPVPADFVISSLEAHKSKMTGQPYQSDALVELLRMEVRELLTDGHRRWVFDPSPADRVTDFSLRACLEAPWGKGNYSAWAKKFRTQPKLFDTTLFFGSRSGLSVKAGDSFYFPARVEVSPTLKERKRYLVRVVPVCEPLKVRVITVGPCWHSPYWAAFQKSLQRNLSGLPYIFSRKDVSPRSFDRLLVQRRLREQTSGEPWVFVSDDASAATDSLRSDLPKILAEYVSDPYVRQEFIDTLNSWLYYPKLVPGKLRPRVIDLSNDLSTYMFCSCKGYPHSDTCEEKPKLNKGGLDWFDFMREGGYLHRQVEGQLMGDRRSFPILCLLHSAMKMAFLKQHGLKDPWSLFAVNGDDGIAVIPKRLVPAYFDWMGLFWKLNRLKTYVSANFLSFNSQFFIDVKGRAKLVPLIRWNLIINNDKNGQKGLDPRVWNKVRECAPHYMEEYLFAQFRLNWGGVLKPCSATGNNWFLPLVLGGAGLETSRKVALSGRQNYYVALVRRLLGGEEGPKYSATIRFDEEEELVKPLHHISTGRSFQLSEEPSQEARPGAVKTCRNGGRMRFRRLPFKYCGFVPWRDLSVAKMVLDDIGGPLGGPVSNALCDPQPTFPSAATATLNGVFMY